MVHGNNPGDAPNKRDLSASTSYEASPGNPETQTSISPRRHVVSAYVAYAVGVLWRTLHHGEPIYGSVDKGLYIHLWPSVHIKMKIASTGINSMDLSSILAQPRPIT